jgi:hypothetical protein
MMRAGAACCGQATPRVCPGPGISDPQEMFLWSDHRQQAAAHVHGLFTHGLHMGSHMGQPHMGATLTWKRSLLRLRPVSCAM